MIIYKITDKENGKMYIGQTTRTLAERIYGHLHGKSKIGKAMNKKGIDNFSIEIIDETDNKDELDELERFWITWYQSNTFGYNTLSGGNPSRSEMELIGRIKKKRPYKHRKCYYKKKNKHKSCGAGANTQDYELDVYNCIVNMLPSSKKEIAQIIGVSINNVSVAITSLEKQKLITRRWKEYTRIVRKQLARGNVYCGYLSIENV